MGTGAVKNFFGDGSPYLDHPLLTEARTSAEVDELERLVGSTSGRVLDVGCGFGRHSIELASRGSDVTGIDPSSSMIAEARDRALAAHQFIDFACTDAADLREVARYDLAICLFTTFGQLDEATSGDAPHLNLLRQTKQALRPGAKLVIELPDRARAIDALVEQEELGPTTVTRRFDKRTAIVTERFDVRSGDSYMLRYRVFDKTELVDLLHDAGFETQQVLDRGLVEPPSTLFTVVAERPGRGPKVTEPLQRTRNNRAGH